MDLQVAIDNVAEIYKEDGGINIEYCIFKDLSIQPFETDIENASSILFFEGNEIRYRTVFNVIDSFVCNMYHFRKSIDEVIPYQGDPQELKSTVKTFVEQLRNGIYKFPSGCTKKPVTKLKAQNQNKGTKMSNILNKMLEVNKASAVNTTKVELGKSANKLVLAKLTPQLPLIVRGYADSPLAELVVANIVAGMLLQFAPNNDKAKILSEAMISAGAQVAIESFDIPGILNDLLANVDIED